MYFLSKLNVQIDTILNVKHEPWNYWRDIIPFFQFIFEGRILKRVLHFLIFPGFYELLEALPLVHHFFIYNLCIDLIFELYF